MVLRKEGQAEAAVEMALSVSDLVNSGQEPMVSPVAGSGGKFIRVEMEESDGDRANR